MSKLVTITRSGEVLSPEEMMSYMHANAWSCSRADDAWTFFSKSIEGQKVELAVPLQSEARDFANAVVRLLENLEKIEKRSLSHIYNDVRASSFDLISLSLEGKHTRTGGISLTAGPMVYEATRKLFLAAACSAIEPRLLFSNRKSSTATNFLDQAYFGIPSTGSFVMRVETPIPGQIPPRLFVEGEPQCHSTIPYARRVTTLLARSMYEARNAAYESVAEGSLEPFRRRALLGVSLNLCEALCALSEAAGEGNIRTSFSFANNRPVSSDIPREVIIVSSIASTLREASKTLREASKWSGAEIIAPVVKLESTTASQGGEVVLHAEHEGRRMFLHVKLAAEEYGVAVEAHRTEQHLRCSGDIVKENVWTLKNPSNVGLEPAQE